MLSSETIAKLEEAKAALEEYKDLRLSEIDDLVENLRAYGVPLTALTADANEAASGRALDTIQNLLNG
jgi:hypothetical protein